MTGLPGQHPTGYYPGQPAPGQGVRINYLESYFTHHFRW